MLTAVIVIPSINTRLHFNQLRQPIWKKKQLPSFIMVIFIIITDLLTDLMVTGIIIQYNDTNSCYNESKFTVGIIYTSFSSLRTNGVSKFSWNYNPSCN